MIDDFDEITDVIDDINNKKSEIDEDGSEYDDLWVKIENGEI